MRAYRKTAALVAAALLLAMPASFAHDTVQHRFAAIGHAGGDADRLKKSLNKAGGAQADFIVVTGIKGTKEACTDKLYNARKRLLDKASPPVIVSLAASDWTACRNSAGRSTAIERLARLREVFFFDASSLGERRIRLTRLSSSAKFRSYAENARWEMDDVLYATVNVPSNNNNFMRAAGRNSEYEDRLVANRSWLRRLFAHARQRKLEAVVLFTEADISGAPDGGDDGEDGYAAVRRQVAAQSKRYNGKILLVDSAPLAAGQSPAITWSGRVGHLSLGTQSVHVNVMPQAQQPFTVDGD